VRAERTIVLLKQFLGDGVMAEPLVSTLAENYSHVDVLALPAVQQVLGHLDGRVSFMHMGPISSLRDTMEQARKIRRKGYDIAYLVNRSFRSAVLARVAKIPVRVGHGTEGRSFLLTQSVAYLPQEFEARSYADLATAMGLPVTRIEPLLKVTERERREGAVLMQEATVVIQPGARREDKKIPTPSLVALGKELQARKLRIALVGGAEEVEAGAELADALPDSVVNLIGKTSIRQSMAALANARLVVGSDTGVMHLAAGLSVPTITVFGSTPAAKWGHAYQPHQIIQTPGGEIGRLETQELIRAAREILDGA
jgi:heptosyltransferase-2